MRTMTAFIIGVTVGLWIAGLAYELTKDKPVPDEVLYEAYRQCIPMSDCRMTPQDWLGYYEIKWRLEEKDQ